MRRKKRVVIAGLAVPLLALACSKATAQSMTGPHILSYGGEVAIGLDTLSKRSEVDENRIDSLTWEPVGSNVPFAVNEPTNGPIACGDPEEFYGQAEGYPNASLPPRMVIGGQRTAYSQLENLRLRAVTAKTFTGTVTCPSVHEDGLTRTEYAVRQEFPGSFKVTRTFRFNSGLGIVQNTGFRPFMPRSGLSFFKYVLVPNSTGQLITYDVSNCVSAPCSITDWNGVWFAHDDGYGDGMFIIRDSSSTTPAFVGIQSGGLSNSNFSSVVLVQPAKGWSGTLTETEYVCFYNQNLWPNHGPTLPSLCVPPASPAVKKPATTR